MKSEKNAADEYSRRKEGRQAAIDGGVMTEASGQVRSARHGESSRLVQQRRGRAASRK